LPLRSPLLLIAALVAFQLSNSLAVAAPACTQVFKVSKLPQNLVIEDAFKQWLLWEQQATLKMFKQSTEPVEMLVSRVPVDLIRAEKNSLLSKSVMKLFIAPNNKEVLWPHHPYNQDPRPPFQGLNIQPEKWHGYLTASRSIVLSEGELRGYSLKMPTDRPHGPLAPRQSEKAMTSVDVLPALPHSGHILKTDSMIEPDPMLIVLKDIMTISDRKTHEGIVLRDIRALDDGNYYLPALSIPYIGREIAKANGKKFENFFAKHFARAIGEAKARFLLRYAMHLEAPNPQNILLQLDRELKPTGKIVFRDISDAYFVKAVGDAYDLQVQMKADTEINYPPHHFLRPFWNTSRKLFDSAGPDTISSSTLNEWGVEHNRAFAEFLSKELELNIPDGVRGYPTREGYDYRAADTLEGAYEILASAKGQRALRAYRARAELQALSHQPLQFYK